MSPAVLGAAPGLLTLAPGATVPLGIREDISTSGSTFRWATVTDDDPLRIRLDGEDTALPLTPESLVEVKVPPINSRVWVQLFGRRVIILGVSGGLLAVSTARAADCLYVGGAQALTLNVAYCVPVSVNVSAGAGMTVSSSTRLAIPVAGVWEFSSCARIFGAVGRVIMDLRKNAAGSSTGGTRIASQVAMTNITGSNTPDMMMSPRLCSMAAGDYVEYFVTSNVASNSINAGDLASLTGFTARLVSH